MSLTPAQFVLEIDDIVDEMVDETVLAVTQKFAIVGLTRVVQRSPVDTGRFRGNWTVGVGTQSSAITGQTDVSGGSTISQGTSRINNAEPYEVIWISNNLPYAKRLENGWSKQAPAGMVAVTFADLEAMTT